MQQLKNGSPELYKAIRSTSVYGEGFENLDAIAMCY